MATGAECTGPDARVWSLAPGFDPAVFPRRADFNTAWYARRGRRRPVPATPSRLGRTLRRGAHRQAGHGCGLRVNHPGGVASSNVHVACLGQGFRNSMLSDGGEFCGAVSPFRPTVSVARLVPPTLKPAATMPALPTGRQPERRGRVGGGERRREREGGSTGRIGERAHE